MKKLLTLLGITAFALGAFAGELQNSTTFETGYTAEQALDVTGEQEGEGSLFWVCTNTNELEATVKAYGDQPQYAGDRNTVFTGNNSQYLAIEQTGSGAPLYRTFKTVYGNGGATSADSLVHEDVTVSIGNGLYVDTLVKLSVSEESMDPGEGVKLAIWAQKGTEDSDPTNFVVHAGYFTGESTLVTTNYTMATPANFDFDAWHRITVKAIEDIGNGFVGFVVFVDEQPLEREGSLAASGVEVSLNSIASQYANSVLPSAVSSGGYKTTLSAVGFAGNGSVDDIVMTDVAPDFAKSDVVFTLNIGEGVTGLTLASGNVTTNYMGLTSGGSVTLAISPNATVVVSQVTNPQDGSYGTPVLAATSDGSVSGLEFTATGSAPVATISAAKQYFSVGKGSYATLSDAVTTALSAQDPTTITLIGDYTFIPAKEGAQYVTLTSGSLVVDLNGHALSQSVGRPLFALSGTASLTVVNSGNSDGAISSTAKIIDNQGTGNVVIGQVGDTYFVAANGPVADVSNLSVVKAKLSKSSNSDDNECALASELYADGSKLMDDTDANYWIVDIDDTPVVTTYDFTVAAIANATATWTVDGVASAELTGLTNGTEVVVTYTANDGYRIATGKAVESYTINGADRNSDNQVTIEAAPTTYTFTVAAIEHTTVNYLVGGLGGDEGSVAGAIEGLAAGTTIVVTYTPETYYEFTSGNASAQYTVGEEGDTTSAGQVVVARIPYVGTVYEPWSYSSGVILWRGTEANFHASTVIDVDVDGTLGEPYAMTADQSATSWQRFASNQSAYSSPGKVLVYDTPGTDQGYKYNPNCTFGPLTFGGMWVKTLAINGLPFSILGSGDRSTEFGATGASTFFKFDASYTIDRTGTTTFYGDATVEIADGATFTAQANSSHVVAVDSAATLKLQGEGTLAVTTMNVAGTLDLSATTVPSIDGNVAFAGYSTLVLPAGTELDKTINLEVCSGTLSAGVVYVKVGDGEPEEAALTISGGSITQITTGIQTEQTFTSEPYPDVVPVGYTYTYVATDAVTIPAVTVNGTLKTSGPITITDLDVANGADFEVVAGNTTVGCSADCKLKGNIKVDAGATLTNTRTDSLSYNHAMTVDIYGTLAMGATRWSIPANCTFKLHAGAQVTGPGDSLASLDFISGATKGLDVYAGEASSARIEGKVRVRANESRIWIGDNTTLVLESGIADGGGHHAGFKQVGSGTLEIHANSTGLSGNASVMTQGTLRIVDTTLAFPVALQGSNSYLEIVATEAETTVPVDVTTANNNISFSGAGKASGSIVFAAEPSSAVQSFLQDNWVGTATLNYAITGASNGTAFKACLYGNENSTVCLGQGATNIFFADADGSAPGVGTKLYFKGDVSLKNGWAYNQNIPLPARSNETVIPELGADEGVTFTTRQDGNRTTFFKIETLKNFAGTIAVQALNDVLIEKVEVAELPEVGTLVVKATKAAETSAIAGYATAGDDSVKLAFDTVNEVSGLYVTLTPVAVPTADTGLTYDGTVQTGVAAGMGYTITGNTATDAGSYQATATLKSGYVWEDESNDAKTIDWTIAKKGVTATITLTESSATLDAEKTTVGAYTAVSAVSFGDDTLTVNVDYTISGLDAQVSAAGNYDVTVQPAASGSNYTFEPVKATLTITASSDTYEVSGETAIGEDGSFTVPEGTTKVKVGEYTLENGNGISIVGTKVTVLAPEVVEEAEQEAIVIDDAKDEVTLNVALVPGLYYGVGSAASLEGGINRPGTLQQYTGDNDEDILTVTKPEGVKGFFKVFVDIKQ